MREANVGNYWGSSSRENGKGIVMPLKESYFPTSCKYVCSFVHLKHAKARKRTIEWWMKLRELFLHWEKFKSRALFWEKVSEDAKGMYIELQVRLGEGEEYWFLFCRNKGI